MNRSDGNLSAIPVLYECRKGENTYFSLYDSIEKIFSNFEVLIG